MGYLACNKEPNKNRGGKTQKPLSSTRPAGSKKLRNMSRPTLTFYWKMDMYIQGPYCYETKGQATKSVSNIPRPSSKELVLDCEEYI